MFDVSGYTESALFNVGYAGTITVDVDDQDEALRIAIPQFGSNVQAYTIQERIDACCRFEPECKALGYKCEDC